MVSMFVLSCVLGRGCSHCVHGGEMSWLCGGFWRFWCGTLLNVLVAVFLCVEVRRDYVASASCSVPRDIFEKCCCLGALLLA
jgi:hypothetical protein